MRNFDKLKLAERFEHSSLPIALKWSMVIAIFITIAMGILGWFLIDQQSTFHQKQNSVLGSSLANQLARAASEPLLAQDYLALSLLVRHEQEDKLIIGMQIFDKQGTLRATEGVSAIWDIRSLIKTNPQVASLIWQTPTTKAITYYSLITYQTKPVGIALVTFDQKPLDAQQEHLTDVLIAITITLVLFTLLLAFPMAYRLFSPIRELVEAGDALTSEHNSSGEGSVRKDEIGRVLASFKFLADDMETKKKVEHAFSQFLSPSIARQVLNQPKGTKLGGSMAYGSVLFCDVVGFTEISENLRPAEVGELLNQYFKYFSIVAENCNGTVDKYIGDCIMILFGVPEADNQHAVQAVTCAVLIQKVTERINQKRLSEKLPIIQFRIGINSGEMLAGNLGSDERMQFTVVGDVVNLTSRICGLCEPKQVFVTRETLEQQGLQIITKHQALGSIQVKGRKQPVHPYKIDMEHFIRQSDIDAYLKHIFGTSKDYE
ncbi:MAG: hypothetical protein COA74_06170 [Gammaproteobacteria bacterium]|nr:MAG: hypothetical protein COA74_14195 [Gammaproteobacteria bacterium]PCJ49149.1 MAG: hypothetical protein COA74_06170 [Gammaproteobacteria bacterium]